MNISVHFKPDILSEEEVTEFEERLSLAQMLEAVDAPDWFWEYGVIHLNGYSVPREMWKFTTPKPGTVIHLNVIPQGDNILPIVAGLALVALTAGIGTFGLPFLGAGFAAGTIGASAAATGVGIIGSLAISALTSAPLPKTQGNEQRQLSNAGITSNVVTMFQLLPVVVGQIEFAPPVITATYTTFDKEELRVHTIVGFEGRCLVEDVKVNGIPVADLPNVDYETREGAAGDAALTLAPLACIQRTINSLLSNFQTKNEVSNNDLLVDQVNPTESYPDWHLFKTDGVANEIWLRLLLPSGAVNSADGTNAGIPLRIEIRQKGTATWLKLPTSHIWDVRKGNGALRVEIKLIFTKQPSGRHFSNASGEYPIYELNAHTAIGQAFAYQAESYFRDADSSYGGALTDNQIPDMTSNGPVSSVTVSSSSDFGASNTAFRAFDRDNTTFWSPANSSLPAWLKVQYPAPKTIRSWYMATDNSNDVVLTSVPVEFYVEGSNNNVDWTRLDVENIDISGNPLNQGFYQIGNPGAYTYYRHNFVANNGAALSQIRVEEIHHYLDDAAGMALGHDGLVIFNGFYARYNGTTNPRCVHGSLNENGANFYLDPDVFPIDEYDVRVMRGQAYKYVDLAPGTYEYETAPFRSQFFTHRNTVPGTYAIWVGQKNYRSDITMEAFSTVNYDPPVDTTGLCCIAVEADNLVIDSISGLFTSYGHEWLTDRVWNETAVPTRNNAALFREVINGYGNFVPVPGQIIDDTSLIDWFAECVTMSHQVNAVFQDRSVADVLQVIAYSGMASIKYSNTIGVVMDRNRSAVAVGHPISPMNSQALGIILDRPELPDAVYVEFSNAADSYRMNRPIVYRRGFDAATARKYDTLTYEGITDEAIAIARAEFDLLQLEVRSIVYQHKLGPDGFLYERGDLVRLSHHVVDVHRGYGIIQQIDLDGSATDPLTKVVSITVENTLPYGDAQGSIDADDDILSVADVLDDTRAMAVSISLTDGNALVKQVTNVVDANTCIFTTPFLYIASGIALGNFVSMGVLGNEVRRVFISAVEPVSLQERIVDLRDCADDELF